MSGIFEPHRTSNSVKLTEDEQSKFDNITYDEIYSMRDLQKLYKLEKYMRAEGFSPTADTVKMRIVDLGGRNPDFDSPENVKEREEDLQKFQVELAEWESDMEQSQVKLSEAKFAGTCSSSRSNDGRPAIRIHRNDKENTKQVENKPLSKEEVAKAKKKEKEAGDLRSGGNYFDKWSKYTEEEMKKIEKEETEEDEVAIKKLKGELKKSAEEEAEPADDGGTGLNKKYAAMSHMSEAEKEWQAKREKEMGNEMFKAKEYANAINAYSLALKLHPGVAAVHTNRAAAYMKLKRWDDVVQDCTWALEVEPSNFKALLRRGAAFLEMDQEGSIEKSVADIENALSQEPENQELQKLHDTALRKVRQYIDKQDARRMSRVTITEVDDDDDEEDEDEYIPARSAHRPAIEEIEEIDESVTEVKVPVQSSKKIVIEDDDSEEDEEEAVPVQSIEEIDEDEVKVPARSSTKVVIEEDSEEEEEEEEAVPVQSSKKIVVEEIEEIDEDEAKVPARSSTKVVIEEDDSEDDEEEEEAVPVQSSKKIVIEEDDSEDEDEEEQQLPEVKPEASPKQPSPAQSGTPPPKNSVEFERTCKSLADKVDVLGAYIKAINPTSYQKLFKDAINPSTMSAFVRALSGCYIPNGEAELALKTLDALSKVSRFSMVVMLMAKKDKDLLALVFGAIGDEGLDTVSVRKLYRV